MTNRTAALYTRDFFALQSGTVEGCAYPLAVKDLGELHVPSGRVQASDPWMGLGEGPVFTIDPGTHRVAVTAADVSVEGGGSYRLWAYLSVVVHDDTPVAEVRVCLPEGVTDPGDGRPYGVLVDAGMVSFADAAAAQRFRAGLDDTEAPGDWIEDYYDSPAHYAMGLANRPLPGAENGENIVVSKSGGGDGCYPVVSTHDASGRLLGIHLDLLVAGPESN